MGKLPIAESTDFGATAAERIAGGKIGTVYVDASDKKLKLIWTDGNIYTAKDEGGSAIAFVAD